MQPLCAPLTTLTAHPTLQSVVPVHKQSAVELSRWKAAKAHSAFAESFVSAWVCYPCRSTSPHLVRLAKIAEVFSKS